MKTILIALVFLATSCANLHNNNFIIYDKVPMGTGADSCMCAFFFHKPSNIKINPLPNSVYVVDSCHKYQIGDDWWWLQHKNNNACRYDQCVYLADT